MRSLYLGLTVVLLLAVKSEAYYTAQQLRQRLEESKQANVVTTSTDAASQQTQAVATYNYVFGKKKGSKDNSDSCNTTNDTYPPEPPKPPGPSGEGNETCDNSTKPPPPPPPPPPAGNETCDNSTKPPEPEPPTPSGGGNNTDNCTVPEDNTVPNNSGGGNETIQNCTIIKICKRKPKCFDKDWWENWDSSDYNGKSSKKGGKKDKNIRVCNMTDNSTFDLEEWKNSSDYCNQCDCVLVQNCTPIEPPPSGGDNGTCNFTCEDIQLLQNKAAALQLQVETLQDLSDMLLNAFQSLSTRVANLESRMDAEEALTVQIQADISDISNSTSGSGASVSEVISYIQDNGVYFGSDWWIGEQAGDLYAWDLTDNSYYSFSAGVNKTL